VEPLIYAAIVAVLLAYRLVIYLRPRQPKRGAAEVRAPARSAR